MYLEARMTEAKLLLKIAENQAAALKLLPRRCVETNSRTLAEAMRGSSHFKLREAV